MVQSPETDINTSTFSQFDRLPSELQAYVFSFVPTRVLARNVARTSRRHKRMVDAHVLRRLMPTLRPALPSMTGAEVERTECCTLIFEAQRPIDTLTTRHRLYFDDLRYVGNNDDDMLNSSSVASLQAHFTFVPEQQRHVPHEPAVGNESKAFDAYDGQSLASTAFASQRNIVAPRPRGTWSEPVTSSLAAIEQIMTQQRSSSRNRTSSTSAREVSLTRRQIHYGLRSRNRTSVSNDRSFIGDTTTTTSTAAKPSPPPTYKFQLDALDSFETWMLSLTVQRLWWQTSYDIATAVSSSPSSKEPIVNVPIVRPMRWEKRVADGLDRVFRDWFKPLHKGNENDGLDKKDQSSNTLEHKNTLDNEGDKDDDEEQKLMSFSWIERIPDERQLELDGESCTVGIQPHMNERAETHPALLSTSSHYYLSLGGVSSPAWSGSTQDARSRSAATEAAAGEPTMSNTDFTFHCTTLQLNAARLLSVIEDIDEQIQKTFPKFSNSNTTSFTTPLASTVSSSIVQQQQSQSTNTVVPMHPTTTQANSRFVTLSGRSATGVSWSDI